MAPAGAPYVPSVACPALVLLAYQFPPGSRPSTLHATDCHTISMCKPSSPFCSLEGSTHQSFVNTVFCIWPLAICTILVTLPVPQAFSSSCRWLWTAQVKLFAMMSTQTCLLTKARNRVLVNVSACTTTVSRMPQVLVRRLGSCNASQFSSFHGNTMLQPHCWLPAGEACQHCMPAPLPGTAWLRTSSI